MTPRPTEQKLQSLRIRFFPLAEFACEQSEYLLVDVDRIVVQHWLVMAKLAFTLAEHSLQVGLDPEISMIMEVSVGKAPQPELVDQMRKLAWKIIKKKLNK